MAGIRRVEVFSAGCSACQDVVARVRDLACSSCEVTVRDMNDAAVAERARTAGIRVVPAVTVDGQLLACCRDAGPTEEALRSVGIGQPLG